MTTPEPDLTWPAVAAFVRQLTHDVRNQLNGLELEAALMADSVPQPEILEGVTRIREQLHTTASHMKNLSAKFAEPSPTIARMPAHELFLIFKEQAESMEDLPPIEWSNTLKDELIEVDAGEMAAAAKEIFSNARDFGAGESCKFESHSNDGHVVYKLQQSKSAPVETKDWGYVPFMSTRRNSYGLGLWETRRLVEASHGSITHKYDPGARELVTTLSFATG